MGNILAGLGILVGIVLLSLGIAMRYNKIFKELNAPQHYSMMVSLFIEGSIVLLVSLFLLYRERSCQECFNSRKSML